MNEENENINILKNYYRDILLNLILIIILKYLKLFLF